MSVEPRIWRTMYPQGPNFNSVSRRKPMTRFITKYAATVGLPLVASMAAYRILSILGWGWLVDLAGAILVYRHFQQAGRTAIGKLFELHGGAEIAEQECLRFLARHLLWVLIPYIAAT